MLHSSVWNFLLKNVWRNFGEIFNCFLLEKKKNDWVGDALQKSLFVGHIHVIMCSCLSLKLIIETVSWKDARKRSNKYGNIYKSLVVFGKIMLILVCFGWKIHFEGYQCISMWISINEGISSKSVTYGESKFIFRVSRKFLKIRNKIQRTSSNLVHGSSSGILYFFP